MKLPRRTISASGRGRCRAAGRLAHRLGASLSDAAGAHHCWLRRRRRDRHPRAPDRSMAVGAARPAIRHREPARALPPISPPRRSCVRRRTAIRSSWSVPANAISATLYDKLNFNFIRDIAPVASIVRVPFVMVVNPSFPAKTVPEFIAYAKANPGKINMASAGNRHRDPRGRRAVQDDGRCQHGSRAVSRRRHASPICSADKCSRLLQPHACVDRVHQGGQAARAGGDHRDALGGAAGHSDRGRVRAGLRGERVVWRRRAHEHAGRDRRQAQQRDQRRPRRSQDSRHGLPTWAVPCLRARPPTSASSSPTKPRSGAR